MFLLAFFLTLNDNISEHMGWLAYSKGESFTSINIKLLKNFHLAFGIISLGPVKYMFPVYPWTLFRTLHLDFIVLNVPYSPLQQKILKLNWHKTRVMLECFLLPWQYFWALTEDLVANSNVTEKIDTLHLAATDD